MILEISHERKISYCGKLFKKSSTYSPVKQFYFAGENIKPHLRLYGDAQQWDV